MPISQAMRNVLTEGTTPKCVFPFRLVEENAIIVQGPCGQAKILKLHGSDIA